MKYKTLSEQHQAEELLDRFKKLVPNLAADTRFRINVGYNEINGMHIFVYLAGTNLDENGMPSQYIKVINVGEDCFHLHFCGFIIMYGCGIPGAWHPFSVTSGELAETIIWVWETRIAYVKAFVAAVESQQRRVREAFIGGHLTSGN